MTSVASTTISFADALTDDGIDYGTGYYVTCKFIDGTYDYYGPFNHEEDALRLVQIAESTD